MQLIGAGLPRTATLSQKIALETLGLSPCYHMVNVLGDLSVVPLWREMFEGGGDIERIFAGFEATVDWPGSFFTLDLAEHYPDAKVLLSVRDGEAWEASIRSTIWGILYGETLIHDLSAARSRVDADWASYIDLMDQMWRKSGLIPLDSDILAPGVMATAMERYNREIIASVPAERLLVWSVSDGWEPLCRFLELPVPETPFPRVNDSKMFADRIIDSSLAVLGEWRAEALAAG
jgi:hypothetical protein